MNNELGISSAAQLVQVHADALALGVHAEGNDAVEQREEQVDQRQHQAQQRGDADQLGEELTRLRCEKARGNFLTAKTPCPTGATSEHVSLLPQGRVISVFDQPAFPKSKRENGASSARKQACQAAWQHENSLARPCSEEVYSRKPIYEGGLLCQNSSVF